MSELLTKEIEKLRKAIADAKGQGRAEVVINADDTMLDAIEAIVDEVYSVGYHKKTFIITL